MNKIWFHISYQRSSLCCSFSQICTRLEEFPINLWPFLQSRRDVFGSKRISPEYETTPDQKVQNPSTIVWSLRRCDWSSTCTNLYGGKPMPMTEAISRSAALTAIPSASTRHASFTTGKNIISTISFSGNFTSCCQVQSHKKRVRRKTGQKNNMNTWKHKI